MMASSSAACAFQSILNDFFSDLASTFSSIPFQSTNQRPAESKGPIAIPEKLDNPNSKLFQKLCYSPNGEGNQFICPQRESTVTIFSKKLSFDPESFGQDSFGRCLPLTWHGRPSIVCDGQQSSFVYTPIQSLRMFDLVDGWLLLARVTPAVVRSLKAGFGFLKDVVFGGDDRAAPIKQVDRCKQELEWRLADMRNAVEGVSSGDFQWAGPLLSDLEEDVEDFLRHVNPTEKAFELLRERLEALTEDIAEVSGMDGGLRRDVLLAETTRNVEGQEDVFYSNGTMLSAEIVPSSVILPGFSLLK